ncbi:MAG TPA: alpha/beta fold hydrolase [Longimicrobiales bacterium]|nr:alpha/beta fold hydrolase [Longimicrobiales bacterium]
MRTRALAIVLTAATLAVPAVAKAQSPTPHAPTRTGYVESNGVRYYYEIHGAGEPLLLLHGGLGSIDMFAPILPTLARHREVIAVDLHGHGRTSLGARPDVDMIAAGDDMDRILEEIGYDRVDVMGYSFGGGVALRLATQHPERVRRLVIVSAGFAAEGFYADMRAMQAHVGAAMMEQMRETPMYQGYVRVAPHPEEFPRLLDAMGAFMRADYDWSDEVRGLAMPTMLVYGDSDMFRPEHIVEFYQLLGGGLRDAGWMREHMSRNRLAIVPDLTHYEMFLSPVLASTVLPFLNGESNAPSWAAQVQQSE